MPLMDGVLAPMFKTVGLDNPRYAFDSVAGRPIVMVFLDAEHAASRSLIAAIRSQRAFFDDTAASLFFFVTDLASLNALGLRDEIPGIRCLIDPGRAIASTYALTGARGTLESPALVVLDAHLRILASVDAASAGFDFRQVLETIASNTARREREPSLGDAPVLVVDRVMDKALCDALVAHYRSVGGARSGFMRDVNGVTRGFYDDAMKRRDDCVIQDLVLRQAARDAIGFRLRPLIRQAFHFDASRMERDIVACYDAATQGFFRAHRDNGAVATRHRRFAVTVNLNTDEYEGGDLRFPEFGDKTYRAPTGGAVVFSGSLLHEATLVTRGVRYAYLPFLYGEAEAVIRVAGEQFLVSGGE